MLEEFVLNYMKRGMGDAHLKVTNAYSCNSTECAKFKGGEYLCKAMFISLNIDRYLYTFCTLPSHVLFVERSSPLIPKQLAKNVIIECNHEGNVIHFNWL